MSAELKALHDRYLADKPGDAEHDKDNCVLCAMDAVPPTSPAGGQMGTEGETFTKDQLDEAIAKAVGEAVGPLQSKITELEASVEQTEVAQAVAEAVAGKDAEIVELKDELDKAVLLAAGETKRADEIHQYFADHIEAHFDGEAVKARREERIAAVKEAVGESLTDDFIEKRADDYAAMDDEAFAAKLEEWAELGLTPEGGKGGGPGQGETAMNGGGGNGGGNGNGKGSALGELRTLRGSMSPRTL